MTGVLLLAAYLVWGAALVRLCGGSLSGAERVVVGAIVGVATGGWGTYLIASAFRDLNAGVTLVVVLVAASAYVVARRTAPAVKLEVPRWFVVLTAGLVLVLLAVNLFGVLAPSSGDVMAIEHVWADTPFHSSIVTSFAYRDNYPPTYPLALGEPLGYPFLVDFITGALVWGGVPFRAAFILINVLAQAGFFLAVALLMFRLTRSARTSVLAVVLLFMLGNLGWLAVPHDVGRAGSFGAWLRDVPWSYTGGSFGNEGRERLGLGLYLGNPTYFHLIPRRSAVFGMALASAVMLVLRQLFEHRDRGVAVLAGLGLGVLPRAHAHSAIVMAVVAAAWFFFAARRDFRQALPSAATAAVVAAAIALPQIVVMSKQTSSFFAFWPGWIGEPHDALRAARDPAALLSAGWTLVRFWVLNGGFLTLLLPVALWKASRDLRTFWVPFGLVWVLGNVVRTQPWDWDNNNYFVYWQMGTVILAAPLLANLAWPGRDAAGRLVQRTAAVVLIAGLTLGSVLSFLYAAEHRLALWTAEEAEFAADVRRATPQDAVVLTSNGHAHPVIALSGRQTVMGFPGWFFSHGLDWVAHELQVQRLLQGDEALTEQLGVDYVVIGPWEHGYAHEHELELSPAFFDPARYEVVLDRRPAGRQWLLLRRR